MERGSPDLTGEHLLHAALEDGTVQSVPEGADPAQIRGVAVGAEEGRLTFEVVEGAAAAAETSGEGG